MSITTRLLPCLALFSLWLSGCGNENEAPPKVDNIRLVPEISNEPIDAKRVAKRNVTPPQIQLNQGDRFHYVKSIDQRLTSSGTGQPGIEAEESIKLVLALSVEKVLDDRSLLSVEFYAAQYWCDLGEQEIRYQSGDRRAPVPPEAKPYAGLVGKGFSFWIGHDNELLDVVDFEQFLQQCLADYPADLRLDLLQQMGGLAQNSEQRLATARTFLDESIALIPFKKLAKREPFFAPGATWKSNSVASQILDSNQELQMKLEHVDGETAHIIINGTLLPASEAGSMLDNGMRVSMKTGQISGSCAVDLKTGLPQSSRILREFDLEMVSLNRAPVVVRKTVETRLDPWTPPADVK